MICKNKKCKQEIPNDALFCLYCGASQADKAHKPKSRGNGTGTVYQLPNGKYKAEVVIGYFLKDGKLKKVRRTKTFTRKKDAVEALPQLRSAGKPEKDPSLYELHEIFTSSKKYDKLSKSQQDKLKYAWERLKPIHHRGIASLTVDELQQSIDSKVNTYYPARDMKVLLSHLYTLAIQREKVSYNKTEYLELPELKKVKKEAFTEDEIHTFWNDYENQHNIFTGYILLMIYAGLRYGELATILKKNIYLDEQYMIGGIKTDAGIDREIAIADRILPIVQYFYDHGKKKLLEMNEDNFYTTYWDTLNRLGVRHLPPQICRHTYFTRLTAAGVQPGIITEAGGHSDYDTTLKNYVRISVKDKVEAVNKI
ncbi:tyrosine-type recombinase/integrase [Anaeromassilibacillus senegalensis]|uniref:tyrosine-type recombinase/integrase n=1 Tax=Anaeromassilibacillus senegalensis TaxID=1673717 RepID=UPI0006829D64|nr:tyrosine-type recombinase/integrase [Anaeromassilibacillus senegalensis]